MTDTKTIRKEMKETLGYNAKQVSVKGSYSSITFTIRDSSVIRKDVEGFAGQYEHYSRDLATGEILCGGNTFCNVYYSDEIKKELTDSVLEATKAAIEKIEDSYLIPVEGTEYMVGKDYMGISVWENTDCGSCISHAYNAEAAAFAIATA